ncbi:hypothetical protein LOK74_21640 [Brevibacillus humidisoli]|uniref:hypothetical protein n=1 Tax=Brevibacillus humidisoli TaxID=2895522 RepID=UPI001E4EE180|nr:hypothetical protein [Brevibacillus humidisoli]UFJ40590.1 hypothetical protein LOK74_21640 [Brevibacillus humidisoli]
MKTIVCFPMKSMVGTFMPPACEVLSTDQPEECFALAALYRPDAVILFSEMFDQPLWEWMPSLRSQLPAEMLKIIVPLHKDEQMMKRMVADEHFSNTYVLPASLTYQEISRQLESVLGLSAHDSVQTKQTERGKEGKVYTLCSHGGAGVTTFAINYPAVLARRNPGLSVAVIDLSVEKPDLTHFFALDRHQLSLFRPDLISLAAAERRDWYLAFKPSDFIPNLFYSSGISRWRSHEISVLLAVLRSRFDFIFVDYGCCFPETEALHRLMQEADCNLFFARSDPFSLSGASNWAKRWQPLMPNLCLLVSSYERDAISIRRIKEVSLLPLYWSIPRLPSGRLVQSLLTRSVLVEELFPPREYINSLRGLAEEMVNREGVTVS